jgi:hypothetical protein
MKRLPSLLLTSVVAAAAFSFSRDASAACGTSCTNCCQAAANSTSGGTGYYGEADTGIGVWGNDSGGGTGVLGLD